MPETQPYRFRVLGMISIASFAIAMGLALFGPRWLTPPGQLITVSQWLLWTTLGFGVVGAVTAPFARRWLLRRRT